MKKEYGLAGITVLCWGTVATVSKLLISRLDAVFVLAWSFLAAALFLFLYNWKKGYLRNLAKLTGLEWLKMAGIGTLGAFLYNYFLLLATNLLKAQDAFVINYLWPAFIILLSCVLLKEKLDAGKALAVACSFAGVLIVATGGKLGGLSFGSPAGVLYAVLAALCYGLYCTLNKREKYDKNLSVMIAYAAGAVEAFAILAVRGGVSLPAFGDVGGLLINGVICNAFPYLTWALALDMGNTAVIANLAYLTPAVSLFVTHFVLGDDITAYSVLGLAFILLGIFLQFLANSRRGRSGAGNIHI